MPYQSNLGRSVEEQYDDVSASDRLLSGSVIDVNTGRTNSARGEGTTTAELVAKFRFLNCCACLFVLLPIVLNPFRLISSSPIKLMLEFLAASLALSVLLVEARIPILGEKVLSLMREFAGGRIQCMDLNVARGRVLALMIMGASISLIIYMALDDKDISSSENDRGSPIEIPGAVNNMTNNMTDFGNHTSNMTDFSPDHTSSTTMTSEISIVSTLFVIVQCTVLSPTVVILISLSAYTLNVMRNFPEFAQVRAYEIQDESDAGTPSRASGFTRPSWVTNVFDSARGSVFDSARGSGYQTLNY